ncbi:MAG: polyprenol phosphomannose-dependent alpha 1,6 mannosyltransferase MptB [Actinomycetota bacterium]|nr:polyprenol phosphomannose-dependent alpha 1,6 mannosyltransferase MptB [Actinomycetota bacterium]
MTGWVTVLAGGQDGTVATTVPLSRWLGMLSATGYRAGHSWLAGLLLFLGIASLALLWTAVLHRPADAALSERQAWWIAAGWWAPFVIGPPLISKDVFSYAAQGLMVRSGLDPYASGVSALAQVPSDAAARLLAAVDPTWRSAPSPYGPLGTIVEHLAIAISGGSPLGAVLVLRGLAVGCVVAIAFQAMHLSGNRRPEALILVVLNPLVLLHLISGAHLEASMGALLLGALVTARHNHWVWAVFLACAAGSIKAPAFAAVLPIIAAHALAEPDRRTRLLVGLRDAAVAAISATGFMLLVDNGTGWVNGLSTPAQGYTPFAPASLIGDLFRRVVVSASPDDLAAGGRITCLLAAIFIVAVLSATARKRSLQRNVGYSLLALALLSPTIYPWYLLWGVLCLAAAVTGRERDWLVLACGVTSVAAITGAPSAATASFNVIAVLTASALMWRGSRMRRGVAATA